MNTTDTSSIKRRYQGIILFYSVLFIFLTHRIEITLYQFPLFPIQYDSSEWIVCSMVIHNNIWLLWCHSLFRWCEDFVWEGGLFVVHGSCVGPTVQGKNTYYSTEYNGKKMNVTFDYSFDT